MPGAGLCAAGPNAPRLATTTTTFSTTTTTSSSSPFPSSGLPHRLAFAASSLGQHSRAAASQPTPPFPAPPAPGPMAAAAHGQSIPAPRPVPGPSGRGPAGNTASVPARSRDASGHQQPPWKSSLDLVWSYSRSQTFYEENIGTSPSFVEHYAPLEASSSGMSTPTGSESATSLASNEFEYSGDEDDAADAASSDVHREALHGRGSDPESLEQEDAEDTTPTGSDSYHQQGTGTKQAAPHRSMPSNANAAWGAEQLPSNARKPGPDDNSSETRAQRLSSLSREALQARNEKLRTLEDDDGKLPPGTAGCSSPRPRAPSGPSSGFSHSSHPNLESRREAPQAPADFDPQGQHLRVNGSMNGKPAPPFCPNGGGIADVSDAAPATKQPPQVSSHLSPAAVSGHGKSNMPSDGANIICPAGTSTFMQSWFNTLNAVMGVGILATPLAFSYAGLILGPLLFLGCGLLTNYTGNVIFSILARNGRLRTYADIGSCAFGSRARTWVSTLLCLEMWAVSVALVILFADSLHAVFPHGLSSNTLKIVFLGLVTPTIFLPLRLLSPVSVVGILSALTLVGVVITDGFIKPDTPGSLWKPHPTVSAKPDWMRLPVSFGLIMSGFSSHPVIPSLARDMGEPARFRSMFNRAYLTATGLYVIMAAVGYLMFGSTVSDEVTKDLARTPGLPETFNRVAVWLMVINPMSKFSLASRPIIHTLEGSLGIEEPMPVQSAPTRAPPRPTSGSNSPRPTYGTLTPEDALSSAETSGAFRSSHRSYRNGASTQGEDTPLAKDLPPPASATAALALLSDDAGSREPHWHRLARAVLQVTVATLIALTAILLPGFEKTMAFLGSFLVITTCVVGPLLANLKLHGREMSSSRVMMDVAILAFSVVAMVVGTIWAFIT